MNDERAASLLGEEIERVRFLLHTTTRDALDERAEASEQGDWVDPAVSLTAEEQDDAIAEGLRTRLAALERAQERLRNGTYGRSIRSGDIISDERLEADPAAELTAAEALEG